jgi:S1-C subfamily serine protease
MQRWLLVLILLTTSTPLRADDQIPAEALKTLKAATVFLKVRVGPLQTSGSGFLIHADGDKGLLVTGDHVITPPRPVPAQPFIHAVFHSGRKEEQTVLAEVAGRDPERDLAVLRVQKVKDLPAPLALTDKVELAETMPVYLFGFPFGQALSLTKGNPAITVGKGSVSSLREDYSGKVKVVQIDGDLNPGNSGGPVVDAKGRLIGIAAAKVRQTRIGVAIPLSELVQMLHGRLNQTVVRVRKVATDGSAEVDVELLFTDPLNKIQKASVRVVPTESLKGAPRADKDGTWPPLPDAREVELKAEEGKAVGSFTVKSAAKAVVRYTVQAVYVNGDKAVIHAEPAQPVTVDFADATPKIIPLSFGSGYVPACLCWSDDAKAFYHLDLKGTVRRIRLPDSPQGPADFKEEARLETGKRCPWFTLSAEGLVLNVSEAQEMWLLDAKTLKVANRVRIGKWTRVVSAPKLSVAYALDPDPDRGRLDVIDLKTAKTIKQYAIGEFRNAAVGFEDPVVTPDGKYLFSKPRHGNLCRFKLDGAEVKLDEVASDIVPPGNGQPICVSPNGEFIWGLTAGGNTPVTSIYPTSSFKKPTVLLRPGPMPMAAGFDTAAGLLYAQNQRTHLIVFDFQGNKLKEYNLIGGREPAAGASRQFLVRPEGRKMLVLGATTLNDETSPLWYVELPTR